MGHVRSSEGIDDVRASMCSQALLARAQESHGIVPSPVRHLCLSGPCTVCSRGMHVGDAPTWQMDSSQLHPESARQHCVVVDRNTGQRPIRSGGVSLPRSRWGMWRYMVVGSGRGGVGG